MAGALPSLSELVGPQAAGSLEAMAVSSTGAVQAAYLLRNCGLRSSGALISVPARSVVEFTDWFRANKLFKRFTAPKPDVFLLAMRTITILACRLRLNSYSPTAVSSAGSRVLPCLPITTRAKRELRPNRTQKERVVRAGKQ